MQQPQLNTTSVYRRLSLVGLSVVLLIMVLNMWIDAVHVGEKVQQSSLSQHTRLMLEHSAKVAQRQLKAKKLDELTITLNDMTEDPYIDQAMVFDRTGKLLAKSDDAKSVQDIYIEQRTIADSLPPFAPAPGINKNFNVTMFVTAIMEDERLIGYLHVSYRQQQALAQSQQFYQDNMQKMLLMMLLSGVIGFMLTRGFARFSRNSYRIVDN
jgi:membrane protein